jgi:hypothetical protein
LLDVRRRDALQGASCDTRRTYAQRGPYDHRAADQAINL